MRSHTRSASGRKVATSAMFLMNAPSGAMASISASDNSQGFLMRISRRLSGSSAPERSMPRLSANIAATVTVASLLKPASASAGETMPRMTSAASAISATRSMRTRSLANNAMAITMTATVAQACQLIRSSEGPRDRTDGRFTRTDSITGCAMVRCTALARALVRPHASQRLPPARRARAVRPQGNRQRGRNQPSR